MKDGFIFPGTSSDEIDDFIEKDSDIKEWYKSYYLYPQYLYELLLQKKDANIGFLKSNDVEINEYNYKWTRAFHSIFSPIVIELGEVCNTKQCSSMTAGKDW
jgi:hypothetical protein